jgi:hypothetical protein
MQQPGQATARPSSVDPPAVPAGGGESDGLAGLAARAATTRIPASMAVGHHQDPREHGRRILFRGVFIQEAVRN